jgi:hypothetical protein
MGLRQSYEAASRYDDGFELLPITPWIRALPPALPPVPELMR